MKKADLNVEDTTIGIFSIFADFLLFTTIFCLACYQTLYHVLNMHLGIIVIVLIALSPLLMWMQWKVINKKRS
jgi:hypothetical protein